LSYGGVKLPVFLPLIYFTKSVSFLLIIIFI